MGIPYTLIKQLVAKHRLVQAATDPNRAAYHVANPASRRKAVLTDIRVSPSGETTGYLWLTSLPGRGRALLARRPDLVPVGSDDVCVRIEDIGPAELSSVVDDVVRYLTDST